MYVIRQTDNGTLVINPRDRFLGRCLDIHRTFSPDEVGLLCHFIDENSVIVEAGANMGSLTVPMALKLPVALTRRSMRKPVSLDALSVHVRTVCAALNVCALRLAGLNGTPVAAALAVSVAKLPWLRF